MKRNLASVSQLFYPGAEVLKISFSFACASLAAAGLLLPANHGYDRPCFGVSSSFGGVMIVSSKELLDFVETSKVVSVGLLGLATSTTKAWDPSLVRHSKLTGLLRSRACCLAPAAGSLELPFLLSTFVRLPYALPPLFPLPLLVLGVLCSLLLLVSGTVVSVLFPTPILITSLCPCICPLVRGMGGSVWENGGRWAPYSSASESRDLAQISAMASRAVDTSGDAVRSRLSNLKSSMEGSLAVAAGIAAAVGGAAHSCVALSTLCAREVCFDFVLL